MPVHFDHLAVAAKEPGQHYALLVSDDVFDHAMERIEADGVPFYALADAPCSRDLPPPRSRLVQCAGAPALAEVLNLSSARRGRNARSGDD